MDKLALCLHYLLLPGVAFYVAPKGERYKSFVFLGGLSSVDIHVGKLLR